MQYSSKTRNFPSIPVRRSVPVFLRALKTFLLFLSLNPQRRAGVVIAHVLGPYLVAKAYTAARKRLEALKEHRQQQQQENTVGSLAESMPAEKDPLDDLFTRPDAEGPVPGPSRLPTESSRTQQPRTTFRDRWVSLIAKISLPPFEVLVDENIRAVHLAVFYLWGRYYHLSKRVTGIRYVSYFRPLWPVPMAGVLILRFMIRLQPRPDNLCPLLHLRTRSWEFYCRFNYQCDSFKAFTPDDGKPWNRNEPPRLQRPKLSQRTLRRKAKELRLRRLHLRRDKRRRWTGSRSTSSSSTRTILRVRLPTLRRTPRGVHCVLNPGGILLALSVGTSFAGSA